jgi:hypothetical protein
MGAPPMRLQSSILGQFLLMAIVVSIVVAFALTGSGASRQGSFLSFDEECALWVGKQCVDPKEYNAALGLVVSVGLNDKAVKQLDLKREVARGLAEREVLLQEAKALGVGTSEQAVDAELLEGRTRVSLPSKDRRNLARNLAMCVDDMYGCAPGTVGLRALPVVQKGEFDYALYERVIRRTTGRSPGHFKEMQLREYTAERMRELVTSGVRISPEEAFLTMQRTQSKVIARQLTVNANWFERFFAKPTLGDIEQFATDKASEVTAVLAQEKPRYVKGCPVVRELLLSTGGERSDAQTETELKKLLAPLARALTDDSVIVETSDADNASLGGRVGCLDASYGPGSDELLKAALLLKKPGEVSPVVRTARGFHALVLEAIVTDENAEALARAQVVYRLAARARAMTLAQAFAKNVIAAVQASKPLDQAVDAVLGEELGKLSKTRAARAQKSDDRPKTDITSPFSIEQNPLPTFTGAEGPAKLLFAMKEPGEVTAEPLALADGYAVFQLKEKDLFTREKFDKEKDNIVSELSRRKADQVLADYVDKLIEKRGGVRYDNRYAPTTRDVSASPKPEPETLN